MYNNTEYSTENITNILHLYCINITFSVSNYT